MGKLQGNFECLALLPSILKSLFIIVYVILHMCNTGVAVRGQLRGLFLSFLLSMAVHGQCLYLLMAPLPYILRQGLT